MNKPIKVIIAKVYINDKSKDGKPLIDRNGKPYKKVAIQTDIHGQKWLSCLSYREDDDVRQLVVDQSAEIVVEQNGEYLNFKLPSRLDLLEAALGDVQKRVSKLEGTDVPDIQLDEHLDDPIKPEDLPF